MNRFLTYAVAGAALSLMMLAPSVARAQGDAASALTRPTPPGAQPARAAPSSRGHDAPFAEAERPPRHDAPKAQRSPWRHPRIPRDRWRLQLGPVFGASPRVDDFFGYWAQNTVGVRALVGAHPVDFIRLGVVGTAGSAPGYGPFGTLGGSVMYTNIKSLFRFGAGINVSAILARDNDAGEQFGWLGVEIFPAIELGWELSDAWGLVVTGGMTATKPGEHEYFEWGGKFAAQVEIGL